MVFDALALYARMPAVNEDHKKSLCIVIEVCLVNICKLYLQYTGVQAEKVKLLHK